MVQDALGDWTRLSWGDLHFDETWTAVLVLAVLVSISGLMLLARAMAVIDGRDFVTPEDVKQVAVPVLAHRLSLTTQAWADGTRAEDVVSALAGAIVGPPVVGRRASGPTQ